MFFVNKRFVSKWLRFLCLSFKGEISFFNTLRISSYIKGNAVVYVGKKVKLTLSKTFQIQGDGFLYIGHDIGTFPRSVNSAFRMGENSILKITGHFLLLSGCQINIDNNAILSLGSGYLNHYGRITCKEKITIGNNVILAEEACLMDNDAHVINDKENDNAPVIILDNSWVGFRTTILKGVVIGEGSIVASNSLVTKSCLNNTLIGGNPAVVIKDNISWRY